MEFFEDSKPVKGMIFMGCSFTWGQGLWYYSYSPTVIEDKPYQFNPSLLNESHHKFKDSRRFARLVADHFDTYEIVHPKNGAAHDQMVEFWTACFSAKYGVRSLVKGFNYDYNSRSLDAIPLEILEADQPHMVDRAMPLDYKDISHVVFQFTHWSRDRIKLPYSGKEVEIKIGNSWGKDSQYNNALVDLLIEENKDLGQLNQELLEKSVNNVKNFLQGLESKGIKTYTISYPEDVAECAKKDEWFKERFIDIEYQDNTYQSFESLMKAVPEMEVIGDTKNFKVPPQDGHPSLECNRVVAKNIIDRIERDNK